MAVNKVYAGGAVLTQTVGAMTPSSPGGGGTFTVTDSTGYPAAGAFPVKINRGLSDEEHILISSITGNTFTVSQRGFDGTSAQSHDAGATVEIYMDAVSMNLIVDHVDDDEVDPHATTLLNTARHALISHTTSMIGDSQITTAKIADLNVTLGKMAANSVDTSKIVDGTIALADLAAAVQALLVPTGTITAFAGASGSVPTGWLYCNGQAVSRTTFSALFALCGTAFGAGDGSTTFNVPDLRQRFPLGVAASGTGSTRGGTGGLIDHVHSLESASAHAKITLPTTNFAIVQLSKNVTSYNGNRQFNGTGAAGVNVTTVGTELGGDTEIENPPFQAVNYMVKT